MQVTFLTQYYPPEVGAPQARISEFARGLARRGWDVSVCTALPNYPAGRVFPEFRGCWHHQELAEGVAVRRAWIRPDGSARASARLIASLSFAASATVSCLASRKRGGILIAETPPLTLGPIGAVIARLTGSAYVLNVSDLWPASLVEMGVLKNRAVIRAAERAEAAAYRAAALITAQSPEIVADIQRRFPECAVRLLSNGVDTTLFCPERRSEALRRTLVPDDGVLVTYAGLHGLAQGLDAVLEAAARLREQRGTSARGGLQFVLVGDGPVKRRLVEKARQLQLENVQFLPPAPRAEIAALLASSDIALIPLARPLHGAIPSKLYEAAASGVPVVVAAGGGAADIVARSGAGLLAEPGNAAAIAAAVGQLAADPALRKRCGAAGRQLACEQYDRELWIERLEEYLQMPELRRQKPMAALRSRVGGL